MVRQSPMALTCGRPRAAPLAVRGTENLALHFSLFGETALVGVWEGSDGLALCVSPLQRPRTDLALLATASPVQPVHLPSSFPNTYHAARCG